MFMPGPKSLFAKIMDIVYACLVLWLVYSLVRLL